MAYPRLFVPVLVAQIITRRRTSKLIVWPRIPAVNIQMPQDGNSNQIFRTVNLSVTKFLPICFGRLVDRGFHPLDGDEILDDAPNNSDGCGGLTGVTPLTLYRDWILKTARSWGASL